MSKPDLRWYLRSMAAADTHYGAWSPVTRSVHALCGVEFQPPGYLLEGLPGYPPDPDQICPQCARKGSRPGVGCTTP